MPGFVYIDDPRLRVIQIGQSLSKEAFGRRNVSFGNNRKSIVCPFESAARYRYRSFPLIFIYVSSTL
jgi:hypothetical protein